MTDLINKKCIACTGFSNKLTRYEISSYLKEVKDWQLSEDGISILKKLSFKNFKQTMFFINALAFICEKEGHHSDVNFGYDYCEILFTTHALGGLSENDFICAAKVDKLLV